MEYWKLRLKHCKDALEENNFNAFIAETASDAKAIFIDQRIKVILINQDLGL